MNKYRPLDYNTKTKTPKHFLFVDTETTQCPTTPPRTRHDFRLGVFKAVTFGPDGTPEWEITRGFTDRTTFWEMVVGWSNIASPIHIVAHNIFYDMTILRFREYLVGLGWDCTSHYDNGLTFIEKWVLDNKRIILLDNSNWFPGKLSAWGTELGLPKLTMPGPEASDEEWFTYCKRDVDIIAQLQQNLVMMIVEEDLGHWGLTLASCALHAFRHRFMHPRIALPTDRGENDWARQAYFGGRTECLYQGVESKGPYYKLDVNSMYPHLMRNKEFPVEHKGSKASSTIPQLQALLKDHAVIADVTLHTTKPYFVHTIADVRMYPVGTFNAHLTTPELKLALDNEWVKEVRNISWYKQQKCFTKYVDFFYTKRLEARERGTTLWATLFKGYLNRLYGKFAQMDYQEQVIGKRSLGQHALVTGVDRETGTPWQEIQVGKSVIRVTQKGHARHAFTAIAAHVTAYGRLYLYDLVEKAGRRNVYYMDTDSLIVNQKGYDNLKRYIDDTELGALKVEGVADEIEVVAPKEYRFGDKWVRKGIRENAQQVGPRTFKQEMWPGIKTLLARRIKGYYTFTYERTNWTTVRTGHTQRSGHVVPYVLAAPTPPRPPLWDTFLDVIKHLLDDMVGSQDKQTQMKGGKA
jgi:hypothetical protein